MRELTSESSNSTIRSFSFARAPSGADPRHLNGAEQVRRHQRRRADRAQFAARKGADHHVALANLGGGNLGLPLRHGLEQAPAPVTSPADNGEDDTVE